MAGLQVSVGKTLLSPAPFTGGERILFKGYAGYRGKVHIELEDPLPLTVQALIYEVQVGT